MLSPKIKSDLRKTIPVGILWFVFSVVYTLLEKGLLGNQDYHPSTGNPYSFVRSLFITPLFSLITGLLVGLIENRYMRRVFMMRSFSEKLFYKSLLYLILILFFLTSVTAVANSVNYGDSIISKRVWNNVWAFVSDYAFISITVYMAAIIIVSQFYTEISESIGQRVLANFFTGKYHKPIVEERIFMFLDMRSSTTIAENLGHVKYFEMLKEYYADLADPIIQFSGEVYQYVGDEIVVSWTLKNGFKNNNCINCFFAIHAAINKQAAKYNKKFGVLPGFKGGVHLGHVTTGEIGVIKREIIFTGDVLNTTARIQELCNRYKVDLIASALLVENLERHSEFEIISLEENELRGRDERIKLFAVFQKNM